MSLCKAVLAGSAAAVAAVTIGATTAMASPMPPKPFYKAAPENFTISINGLTNLGTGNATGPVNGAFTSKDNSNTDSVFTFAKGSVDVTHTDVSNLNPTGFTVANACTASATGGGTYTMDGLTGIDRHAKGSGTFTATVTVVEPEVTTYQREKIVKIIKFRVKTRHGYEWVTIREVRHIKVPVVSCNGNVAPTSVTVAVTGTGTETNPRDFHYGKI